MVHWLVARLAGIAVNLVFSLLRVFFHVFDGAFPLLFAGSLVNTLSAAVWACHVGWIVQVLLVVFVLHVACFGVNTDNFMPYPLLPMALFFQESRKTKIMDLTEIWGVKDKITIPEVAARAAVMFVLMIILIRLAGMRSFGKGDVFDSILTILLGAVLARGIIGATPFLSAVAGGAVITSIHILLSNLSFYSHQMGKRIKGHHRLLYEKGRFIKANMDKVNLSKHDIEEQMRLKLNTTSLDRIEAIYYERTGEISFIKATEGGGKSGE